jgi:hypothetical protein
MDGDVEDTNILRTQGNAEDSNGANTPDVQDSNVLNNQGEIKGSSVVNNQGTIQVARDFVVGDVAPPAPTRNPPTAFVRTQGRVCYLYVTNNDATETFVVEVAIGGARLIRPRWDNEQEERTLKRGETAGVTILWVEPERPRISLSLVDQLVTTYQLPAYKRRIAQGVRVVRFFGAAHIDVQVPTNKAWFFVTRVLSDSHDPVVETHTYGVTDNCNLVLPFDQAEVDRLNALGTAERDALVRYVESLKDKDDG